MKYSATYLNFAGMCREAFTFYQSCLGGDLSVMTVGDSPMAAGMPAEMHNAVFHATLRGNGIELMGSDLVGSEGVERGNAMRIAAIFATEEEIRMAFEKLSEGGTVGHPLAKAFFGFIGDLTDRFGIGWFMVTEGDEQG